MTERAIRRTSARESTPKPQRVGVDIDKIGVDPNTIERFEELHSGTQEELIRKLEHVRSGAFTIGARRARHNQSRITVVVEYNSAKDKKSVKLNFN